MLKYNNQSSIKESSPTGNIIQVNNVNAGV